MSHPAQKTSAGSAIGLSANLANRPIGRTGSVRRVGDTGSSVVTSRRCAHCGAELRAAPSFCPSCGARLARRDSGEGAAVELDLGERGSAPVESEGVFEHPQPSRRAVAEEPRRAELPTSLPVPRSNLSALLGAGPMAEMSVGPA